MRATATASAEPPQPLPGSGPGPAPAPPVGLYVHVPFCLSLCPYCDFVVYAGVDAAGPRNRVAPFLAALAREIDLRADALDARFGPPDGGLRAPLETLYLGGGTPSLLAPDALAALIARVRDRYGLRPDAEVTLEANPGPADRGDARAQRAAGVTRISFGAQSLDARELRTLGRRHLPEDVVAAVLAARDAGIGSINIDLLYDVPGQRLNSWMSSIDEALALSPDHLSLYALTLDDPVAEGLTGPGGDHLPTRAGARRWRVGAREAQDEDRAAAMYHHAIVRLDEAGFRGYEISNWARPGHESRHNRLYWSRGSVEAVGPGAHAFDGLTRRWTVARFDRYVAALVPSDGSPGTLPPGGAETVVGPAARAEAVILGLRTDDGIPSSWALEPPLAAEFGWALAAGLLSAGGDERVRLTTRGRLLSNELFARLI